MNVQLKVGVFGAGAAGLCVARHLSIENGFFVTVFEQQGEVGGTWSYNPKIGLDENGFRVYSSMYDNLRTNLPKECMGFPDFPFSSSKASSFIHHFEVEQYLKDYASHFDLLKNIKFYRKVEKVKLIKNSIDEKDIWEVDVLNLLSKEKITYFFDAVVVCSGTYSFPFVPAIEGLETFQGKLVHSHDYRNNLEYKNLNVLVIGAGPSGIDIAVEVSKVAKMIVLNHHHSSGCIFKSECPSNLTEERSKIISIQNGQNVVFESGLTLEPDVIILCTGYHFNLNFLDESCEVQLSNKRVTPLFKHFISVKNPTLAILGLTSRVIPFVIYHQQVKALLKLWNGSIELPKPETMLIEEDIDFRDRLRAGMPSHYAHCMGGAFQWNYLRSLADWATIDKLNDVVRRIYESVAVLRIEHPISYKLKTIQMNNDGNSFVIHE